MPATPAPAVKPRSQYAVMLHAVTTGTFLAASSVPTPLYRLYQEMWGLTPV